MSDRADWCFVSGAVSVLEMHLLGPQGLSDLGVRGGAVQDVLARARRSPVYAGRLVDSADPIPVAAGLEAALVDYMRAFTRQCPDPRVADLFLAECESRELASALKSRYGSGVRRRAGPGRDGERVPSGAERLPERGGRWERAVAAVGAIAEENGGRVPGDVIDLVLDGAWIEMIPGLTAPLGSALLDEWSVLRSRFVAAVAVVRGRLCGVEPAVLQMRLVPAAAGWGGADGTALARLIEADLDSMRAVLAELVPPEAAGSFDPSRGAGATLELAGRLDEALDAALEAARLVTFGPERVFAWFWRLWTENRAIRAALCAAA